jgi:hypothetical protein
MTDTRKANAGIFGAPADCPECGSLLVYIRPDYPEHLTGPLCPTCDGKDLGYYLDWLNDVDSTP